MCEINNREQQKELVKIKRLIAENFTQSDWLDFSLSLGSQDIVDSHPRLLRSLSFGDDDYEGNIIQVLISIIKRDSGNFNEMKSYLAEKYGPTFNSDFISTAHSELPKRVMTFSPQVFEIPNKPQNDKLVTVMYPFTLSKTYDAVKRACDHLGLECKKADDIWVNSTIIQDIFELIVTCHIVVADLTGKNPNVFYEVGIAHALGKTVVPMTQSQSDVPFDLQHHRVLQYHPNDEGYTTLTTLVEQRLSTLKNESFT